MPLTIAGLISLVAALIFGLIIAGMQSLNILPEISWLPYLGGGVVWIGCLAEFTKNPIK